MARRSSLLERVCRHNTPVVDAGTYLDYFPELARLKSTPTDKELAVEVTKAADAVSL